MIESESKCTRRHDRAILALLGEPTVKDSARRARVEDANRKAGETWQAYEQMRLKRNRSQEAFEKLQADEGMLGAQLTNKPVELRKLKPQDRTDRDLAGRQSGVRVHVWRRCGAPRRDSRPVCRQYHCGDHQRCADDAELRTGASSGGSTPTDLKLRRNSFSAISETAAAHTAMRPFRRFAAKRGKASDPCRVTAGGAY